MNSELHLRDRKHVLKSNALRMSSTSISKSQIWMCALWNLRDSIMHFAQNGAHRFIHLVEKEAQNTYISPLMHYAREVWASTYHLKFTLGFQSWELKISCYHDSSI